MKSTLLTLLAILALATIAPAQDYNVTLAWDDEINDQNDIAAYRVYKIIPDAPDQLVGEQLDATNKSATITLPVGEHTLYVVAVDNVVFLESEPSSPVVTRPRPAAPTNVRITVTVLVEAP